MQINSFLLSLLLIVIAGCSSAHIPVTEQGTPRAARGSVQSPTSLSQELIYRAAWAKKAEIADLIAKGADPDASTDQGITALHLAVMKANQEAVAVLLDLGAEPNVVDELDFSPLRAAVGIGDPALARLLIAGGADPDFAPYPLKGPLFAAISSSNIEMIDLLVKNGANLNAGYFDGEGYVFPLTWSSDDEIFEHLLKTGANPDIYLDVEEELSLLLYLLAKKETKKLSIALEYGADPNIRGQSSSQTPLHIAAHINDAYSAKLLLRHGADLIPKDKWLSTPLDYAKERSSDEVAAFLTQAGAR